MTTRLIAGLARAALISYGLAAALGALVLWGWALDLAPLRDLGAQFPPMPPAAALGMILLAGSFLGAERGEKRGACAAAAVAALIGALSLAGVPLDLGLPAPELMSPAAAIAMLALALVTPLAGDRKVFGRISGIGASGLVAGLVGLVAFFALLGMSLRMLRFDLAAPLLGFSAPGALAALLAAMALAAARPGAWLLEVLTGRSTGAVVTRWLLPAAFAVPLVVSWMRLIAEREGLFGEAFGMALFTLLMIALFSALILWVAHRLDAAERSRAAAEGQASEQREWLQVTLAAIGDGVIAADAAGRVRFLNAAAQRLTGWRADEAAGRPAAQLLQLFDERNGAPIDSPLQAALRQRVAAGVGGDPALRARDGSVHAVDINAAPIVDADGVAGAVLVLRDAAAHRRAERAMREAYAELDQRVVRRTAALERASAALQERNALLNAITTSTPDLIFAKDRQGRMLMGNPAWSHAAGRGGGEAPGLDDNERIVIHTGEAMMLEEIIGRDGEEKIYLTTKSPLRDEQGRVVGLIGIATDITERKRGQRELEKLVVAEQRLRAEAERANRAKDEFLAIVSHELRSPLNALRGWSHLLATTRPLDAALVERGTQAIMRNVDSQTRLIDDLLDTSRIVSGKLNIERRIANLVDIVHAALEAARHGAGKKAVDLRFVPDDPAIMVVGDAGRLQQLASNLISNAVKFTPERGLVQVSLLRNGERVQLQVRDNGIGIAPEFLPHVFDRFTQADTSSTRRAGGLGIGLALVRHIALLHGGQVRADSPGIGRGAVFIVDLPAAPQQAALAVADAPAPERKRLEGALAGLRVWLVDDDADAHEVVALTLGQYGAAVQAFGSSAELSGALEKARAAEAPDVFLVDLAMPGEDGFAALRRVRALEMARGAAPVPAIALTAFTQIERERLMAAGFVERVDKPLDAAKLVAAIRAARGGGYSAAPSGGATASSDRRSASTPR
jgi:PAS domain S-box-containing protein